jgi:hypothetical protein
MVRTRLFGLAAAVVAVGVLVLPGTAFAATGSQIASAGQTGMQVSGGGWQFRFVQGTVFGRDGGNFAATQAGIGGSVSLVSTTGVRVLVGISTGTSSHNQPWSPGVTLYHGHTIIATQNDPAANGETCISDVCTPGDSANFPDQQSYQLQLFYNRSLGNVYFRALAASGDFYHGPFPVGTGLSFQVLRVTADFGNTPFDSAGYQNPPAATKTYLTWTKCSLTSYNGTHGGFIGPWTRHHVVLVDAAGGAHAGSLFNSGTAFHTYLTP